MDERTIIYLDDAIDAAVKGADPYYKDSIVEELMNVPSAQPERETAKFIRWMECKKLSTTFHIRRIANVLSVELNFYSRLLNIVICVEQGWRKAKNDND